jgi:hypothetical protein
METTTATSKTAPSTSTPESVRLAASHVRRAAFDLHTRTYFVRCHTETRVGDGGIRVTETYAFAIPEVRALRSCVTLPSGRS